MGRARVRVAESLDEIRALRGEIDRWCAHWSTINAMGAHLTQLKLFADACSVFLVGPAAIWAIGELETRPGAALGKSPSSRYPPPVVRVAVARVVAEKAGLPPGEDVLDPHAVMRVHVDIDDVILFRNEKEYR